MVIFFSPFFLQETHWTTEQKNLIRSQWGFECVVAGNHTGSRVVAVLFKNNFKIHSTIIHCDRH